MPYVIEIGIKGNRPSKNCGIEPFFVNKFIYKGCPFNDPDFYLYSYISKSPLDDLGTLCPDFISLVRYDLKAKGLPSRSSTPSPSESFHPVSDRSFFAFWGS